MATERKPLVEYAEDDQESSSSEDEYIVPQKRARLQNSGQGTGLF